MTLIPLILSDLLLNNSAVTRIKVESTIKHVATASIVGLSCSLKPVHICIGIVVFSRPAKNNTTTTSSKDVTNANKPPDITPGNINEDFDTVKDADWIVEAVVERIDIKHDIYSKIFKNRKDGAIVSSNTSSIPIKVLSEKLTDNEKKRLLYYPFL